jgi:hypothetical protein
MVVPDSKPPVVLLGVAAVLLSRLIIGALRRRHQRRATARGSQVTSTGRVVKEKPSTSSRGRAHAVPRLAASTKSTARVAAAQVPVGAK